MNLYPSSAGVYDEAVEASAERIMLVMQDNVSSGYSSDADTSEGRETDSCSIADDPSSSSSSSASTCGEDESIESEISFLQKKQSLLQRASAAMKREEAYDVSIARDVVNGAVPRGSSLWIEAQEVLDILNCREGKDEAPSKRKTMAASIKVDKKPRIDLSSVVCLSSSNFSKIIQSSPPSYKRSLTTMPFTSTGPWMAEALTQSVPSPTQSHDNSLSRWEVVKDPELGLLVVPPSKLPLQSGVELQDALYFTSSAQLITLSAPPFCVIHANKAFSIFSELSNDEVIGKPVESILRVDQDTPPVPRGTTQEPTFSLVARSNKPCRLVVTPITDRARNPRGGISHLLVRIEPCEVAACTADGALPKVIKKGLGVHGNHHVFGTVG